MFPVGIKRRAWRMFGLAALDAQRIVFAHQLPWIGAVLGAGHPTISTWMRLAGTPAPASSRQSVSTNARGPAM